jgi:hypothetical protein
VMTATGFRNSARTSRQPRVSLAGVRSADSNQSRRSIR